MKKILEKLKKLISHEESARRIGNIAEAEAFAEKIQYFLDEYNLSKSDIEIENDLKEGISSAAIYFSHDVENWQSVLAQGVCEVTGCYSLYFQNQLLFLGRKNDREMAISLYKYFEKLGLELSEKYEKASPIIEKFWFVEFKLDLNVKPSETEIKSFLLGFAIKISNRLAEKHKESKSQTNSYSLMVVSDKHHDAEEFANKVFNPQEVNEMDSEIDQKAFDYGFRQGNQVALTDKVISQ